MTWPSAPYAGGHVVFLYMPSCIRSARRQLRAARTRDLQVRILVTLIALTPLPSVALPAQETQHSAVIPHPVACVDTVSLTGARPRFAYIHAVVPDSTGQHLTQMADEFTQSLAQHMRTRLSAHGDTLPAGEPLIGWRDVENHIALRVTASRTGPASFTLSQAPHSITDSLLLEAARAAQLSGEGVFWPSDPEADSLAFGVGVVLSAQGKLSPGGTYRYAFPVFSVMAPPETPAVLTAGSYPEFPAGADQLGATGVVVVQFRIDSAGHVAARSIREEWPASQPRPTGALLSAYTDFLQAVMSWLPAAEFTPARIGSCPVSQVVQQSFSFDSH